MTSSPLPRTSPDRPAARYTVEELSRIVGMSPRNVRAHQSRKLLQPPVRRGRVGYYDDTHVRRLEHIVSLQRQGFNLVSISAILGAESHDDDREKLTAALQRALRERPGVFHSLNRHGLLGWDEDGAVRIARPGVLRAALDLVRAGIPAAVTLQCLARLLDRIDGAAEELIRIVGADILPLNLPSPDRDPAAGPDDHSTGVFAQHLVELLASVFRAAAENHGRELAADLLASSHGAALWVEESVVVENG
ncbi:MerR family transcriptional regulator [Streptomyces sp. NBC_00249]|uniref:MerR family transcriptional regulator n=1 Tax=Streptomyces sp. NBC_00249 TaxID=2975690 RepID=UPI00225A0169|nr:MerR family transcriptional regulator [Streptomyces sp. NBC_00249]MCX5195362.1 MerR family transcriptional regulator [Streptomyces sp. NBC_00249]